MCLGVMLGPLDSIQSGMSERSSVSGRQACSSACVDAQAVAARRRAAPRIVPPARMVPSQLVVHPSDFTTRLVEAGNFASLSFARGGRTNSAPPQLGHLPLRVPSAQAEQKVHSNEQMRASVPDGS